MSHLQVEIGKFTRFASHSFAALVGFLLLAILSPAAELLVMATNALNLNDLAAVLSYVEHLLLYGDVVVFTSTFCAGVVELFLSTFAESIGNVKAHWR